MDNTMTHSPETGAINQLQFSDANFWYACRQISDWILLVPDSGTDQNTFLFQARKWRGCDWNDDLWLVDDNCWHFKVSWSCFMQWWYLFICLIFSEMFIYGARNFHSRRTWYEKLASKTGAGFWNVCHGPKRAFLLSAILSTSIWLHFIQKWSKF